MENKKINRCLNSIKAVCCIGVAYMHCSFPSKLGGIPSYFLKFAVPIFFMISGYFSYYNNKNNRVSRMPKKILHILKILVFSELIYGIINLIKKESFPIHSLLEAIPKIFTGTFFNGTLWFLYALFWSYIVLYFIYKYEKEKWFYYSIPIVLIFHIVLRLIIKNQSWYNAYLFRNFILYGLPFVLMGSYIKYNEKKIANLFSNKICIIGIILGEIIMCVEWLLTRIAIDMYFGTIISSFFIFVFAVKNSQMYINKHLEYIGTKLSMYVYILHLFAIRITYNYICKSGIMIYIAPIIAIIISLILAYIVQYIVNIISNTLLNNKTKSTYSV